MSSRSLRPDRALLAGVQAGHSWTVSGTPGSSNLNDTSDFALGSAVDLTGKGLVFWIKVSDWSAFSATSSDVQLIDNSGSNGVTSSPFIPNGGPFASDAQFQIKSGEWRPIFVPWSIFPNGTVVGTAATVRTAPKQIRIHFYPASGKTPTIKLGGVGTYTEAAALSGTDSQQQTTAIHNGVIDYINSSGLAVLPVGEDMQLSARS